jgi:23S rRNA pseudouridine1911/1915/1917 synthase
VENSNSFEIVIGEDKINQRIDKVLSSHPLIGSRSKAAQLIDKDNVKLIDFSGREKSIKASYQTQSGDKFLISLPQEKIETGLIPFDLKLDVLFEDQDLLVLNKPANLVVHPAHGHAQETLVNALIHHTKDLSMGFGENRPGIVHRLDKETSGLLVVAKNNETHEGLALQFKNRTIHRIYWALVFGNLKDSSGQIKSQIARHPSDRKRFASLRGATNTGPQGKTAITNFKKIEYSPKGFTLVELKLETGRTHQIRVHISEKQHSIVGDNLYGSKNRTRNLKSHGIKKIIEGLGRIALHAKELGFVHPRTKEKLFFTSPVPSDLIPLFEEVGIHAHKS